MYIKVYYCLNIMQKKVTRVTKKGLIVCDFNGYNGVKSGALNQLNCGVQGTLGIYCYEENISKSIKHLRWHCKKNLGRDLPESIIFLQ